MTHFFYLEKWQGKGMGHSWFFLFIVLAAAILLAYYQCWYIWIGMLIILLLGGVLIKRFFFQSVLAVIVLASAVFYIHLITVAMPGNLSPYNNLTVYGKVGTHPEYDGKKSSFVLLTDSDNPYQKKLQVFAYCKSELNKGDKVSVNGSLEAPAKPGNPGEFDYAGYLAHNHIYYILSVEEESNINIVSKQTGPQSWLNLYRLRGEELIYDVLPEEEASIVMGILLGKKEAIEAGQYSDFQKIGVVHIFAVSGLHVGFLLLFCTILTSFVNLSRRVKFIFTIAALFLYGSIVGWPLSVVRATIMASLGLLAYYMGREKQLLNSLGLAGIIILIIDPEALFKISFQLSFMATWGLVYLFPLLKKKLDYKKRLGDLVLVPLCAQIAVIPLVAYHFNLFSPVSILSNILISYLVGVIVILGLLALILAGIMPIIIPLLLYPIGLIIEVIISLSALLKDLPSAFLWVATPGIGLIILYYAGLLLFTAYLEGLIRKTAIIPACILMAVFLGYICLPAGIFNRGIMEVVVIDVGQGDGILLKTPQGKFILIDGGGSDFSDVGSRKVLPYLRHRGIRELFLLVNTHPDTDHLQGLETVAAEMPIDYLGIPSSLFKQERYQYLKQVAAEKEIPILALERGQEINIEEELEIKVLYPGEEECAANNFNNQSLVLRSQYGDFSLLLTGDLENEGLQNLLDSKANLKASVVKVPHHGSRGSLLPEFYEQSSPHLAVISAGRKNIFGHPHPTVIDALEARNIKILRTDTQGAITISSDGRSVIIDTYR